MEEKIAIRPTIDVLEIGEEVSFPLLRLTSVKTTASDLGMIRGRVYATRIARSEGLIYVSRVS